jgi:hypothetical protein
MVVGNYDVEKKDIGKIMHELDNIYKDLVIINMII